MNKYYIHYFEQLAIKNKLIASTADETAFYFVQDQFDLEAFDNAIKNAGKTPALILENYSADVTDGNSRNYFKNYNGRFTILTDTTIGDRASIQDAKELCERIADQLLSKMRADLGEGGTVTIDVASPRIFFHLNQVKTDFVGPIATNFYGVTVGFQFKAPFSTVVDPADWNA